MTHNPVPRADRDRSEQPVWPPQQRRAAEREVTLTIEVVDDAFRNALKDLDRKIRLQGASRPEPVRATAAQVQAAHDALSEAYTAWRNDWQGRLSLMRWAAKPVADAVVTTGHDVAAHWKARFAQECEAHEITGLTALGWLARGHQLEAERDRLAAKVARVETLADSWANRRHPATDSPGWNTGWDAAYDGATNDLRAALSDPDPAQAPQERAETGLERDGDPSGHSGTSEALGGAESGEGSAS